MQKAMVLLISFLVFGCGGSSTDNAETEEQVNRAPVISLVSAQTAQSGETITLEAQVSDPDGDTFTQNWQSDRDDITFSDTTSLTPTITLPVVSSDQMVEITFTATDSNNKLSQKKMALTIKAAAIAPQNQAPIITLAEKQSAQGGQSVVLSAKVRDLEGDSFTLTWQADRDDIVFSDPKSLTPTLSLPDVSEDSAAKITLIATDSQDNQSLRSLELTITAKELDPKTEIIIEIAEQYQVISGNTLTITANVYSNIELTGVDWDLADLDSTYTAIEDSTSGDKTESTLTLTAPIVELATSYPIKVNVVTEQGNFSAGTVVNVVLDDAPNLIVTLPEQVEIRETTQFQLAPEIQNTQAIDSYQWRWLSQPEAQLLTPNAKILNFITPQVDEDSLGELELTVTMGDITKVAKTNVVVGNYVEVTGVDIAANRLVAVKGQKITFNVITDNLEQIKSWSWRVVDVNEQYLTKSKTQLDVSVPDDLSGQKLAVVTYKATLADDTQVTKNANITLLSETSARASFDISTEPNLVVYNNTETKITASFTDPFGVSDSLTLVQPFTSNTFDKAELKLVGDKVEITLLTNTVEFDHLDVIHLEVAFGDYRLQHPIYLNMRANN